MKKSISLLILTAILLFSFASCNSQTNDDSTEPISNKESSNDSSIQSESSNEESDEMSKEPINTEYVNAASGKYYSTSGLFPEVE